MIGENEGIIQRVSELINESGLKKTRFAVEVGINASNFGKKLDGKLGFTDTDLKLISKKTNVRIGWLATGQGEKFKAPEEFIEQVERDAMLMRSYDSRVGVPFYNIEFELGFSLMENDQTTKPDYMINFEPYNRCDCWCRTHGNSMYPTIASGDIIALKEVHDHQSCLINDEIYAIVTKNDLRTIKRVRDNGDTVTLIPDNKDFSEQTISKNVIRRVFKVIGSVKMF